MSWIALSLGVHGAAAGALVLAANTSWTPKLDVVWLNLDNRLGAPQAGAALPTPPIAPAQKEVRRQPSAAAPKPPGKGRPARHTARRKRSRRRQYRAKAVSLAAFAPGDAALLLLLRNDRIRGGPYEEDVKRLLGVFYDFKTLLWDNGIDAIQDLDALLIATPNPYRVTRTFLAVRYSGSVEHFKAALSKSASYGSKHVTWKATAGGWQGKIPTPPRLPHDTRVVALRDQLAVLGDASIVSEFFAVQGPTATKNGEPGDSDTEGARPRGGPGGGAKAKGTSDPTLFDRLRTMQREGGRRPGGPALLLQAINLKRLIRVSLQVPAPTNVQVTLSALDPAKLQGLLTFDNAQLAASFLRWARARLDRARRSFVLRVMGYGGLLDDVRRALRRRRAAVEIRLTLRGDTVRRLLALVRQAIPQVEVPGMSARIPRAGDGSRSDGGSPRRPQGDAATTTRPADASTPVH